jgi:hypothetical protein
MKWLREYAFLVALLALRVALLVGFFLAAFGAPAQAQSFEETLRWMHNTAAYEGGGYHAGDKTVMDETEVPLSNTCHNFVIIQTTHYLAKEHRPDNAWKITMDLSTIEPSSVRTTLVKGKPWSYVDVSTTNDEDTIHTSDRDTSTSGVSLFFNGTSYALRFAKALRHAVVLCGGKSSAF